MAEVHHGVVAALTVAAPGRVIRSLRDRSSRLDAAEGVVDDRLDMREPRPLIRSRTKFVATVVRGFLRHVYQHSDLPSDLANAVLRVMHRCRSGWPKAVDPDQFETLFCSCESRTPDGLRDRAYMRGSANSDARLMSPLW